MPGVYRTTDTCARCDAAIPASTAAVFERGTICRDCESKDMIREATRSHEFWGLGPLGWSLIAFVCNPCEIFSILGIVGGLRELRSLEALGPEAYGPTYRGARMKSITAVALGFAHPVLVVLLLGFMLLRAAVVSAVQFDPDCGSSFEECEEFRSRIPPTR